MGGYPTGVFRFHSHTPMDLEMPCLRGLKRKSGLPIKNNAKRFAWRFMIEAFDYFLRLSGMALFLNTTKDKGSNPTRIRPKGMRPIS